jgi:hypothetical protein
VCRLVLSLQLPTRRIHCSASTNMALASASIQYRKGICNRLYRHRQCLRDRCEVLLLPRPRLRWTAMWAFPSNIAQRLASGRPPAGNYFFSSLILGDNSYLSVAVCFTHWCGGGGHHGYPLYKRRGGGGCDREYRTGAARVDFLTDA